MESSLSLVLGTWYSQKVLKNLLDFIYSKYSNHFIMGKDFKIPFILYFSFPHHHP